MSPVASADVLLKYSTKVGAAGNANAGTAAGSLGKYISTTQVPDNSLHNLFDQISGTENAALTSDYRCIFIHNAHATLAWQNVFVYLLSETTGGAAIAIGADTVAASAIGAVAPQALEVANETTAPAGVIFSSPTTFETGVSLGTIPAGQCKALWIKRTALGGAAVSGDSVSLRFQGNSL